LAFFSYCSDKGSNFLLGPTSDHNCLTYISHIDEITVVCHHAWLALWDRISLTFLPRLALNYKPPIFASHVPGILQAWATILALS
jgi:hypothetical protein